MVTLPIPGMLMVPVPLALTDPADAIEARAWATIPLAGC